MGTFHQITFPFYKNGIGVHNRELVARARQENSYDHDIEHDLVPDGTRLLLEDWETDGDIVNVVIEKKGWVWVEILPHDSEKYGLPSFYYDAVRTLRKNLRHRASCHPWL